MKHLKKFNESKKTPYPTMDEVEKASHYQICSWYRFLDSPGLRSIGEEDFNEVLEEEGKIMDRITARLKEFGGFTPSISKALG